MSLKTLLNLSFNSILSIMLASILTLRKMILSVDGPPISEEGQEYLNDKDKFNSLRKSIEDSKSDDKSGVSEYNGEIIIIN